MQRNTFINFNGCISIINYLLSNIPNKTVSVVVQLLYTCTLDLLCSGIELNVCMLCHCVLL